MGSGIPTTRGINTTWTTLRPTLSWDAVTPLPNAAGWNNSDVTLSYVAYENSAWPYYDSGVASATPGSPLTFAAEGADQTQQVTVTDVAGNTATFTSPVVNIDKTAPHLLSIDRSTPANEWTNADSLTFVATFDEAVFGLAAGNFSLDTTSTAGIDSVSSGDGGVTWSVLVTGGDLADFNGTLGLNLDNNADVVDIADNPLVETSWTGQTYTIDNLAPTVNDVTATPTLVTDATEGSATFTVVVEFSEPMDPSAPPCWILARM